MKASLHKFLHISRDEVCGLLKRNVKAKKSTVKKRNNKTIHETKHFYDFSDKACSAIKEYFTIVTGDSSVSCAIRVASAIPEEEQGKIGYFTVGRSSNLHKDRGKTSEYIAKNEGIPEFFSNSDVPDQGLLFYYDLNLAAENKAYKKTKNDTTYNSEINTMIVAPINGWNGNKIDLIGLLYINSKTQKILKPKHAELVAVASDSLALTFTAMFARLHSINNMPELDSKKI